MIKIDLIDRILCEDCPNIVLEANTTIYGETKTTLRSSTTITCKNKERCQSMMEYLEHASKTLP